MTGQIVRKEVTVRTSRDHAFRVFTGGIDRWWPREHHIGKSPLKQAVIESRVGGRWYAICEDGSECDIGAVHAWDPPGRLVLTWKINGGWQYDAAFTTELHVTFTETQPGETHVVLEHRGLEAYGAAGPMVINMLDAPGGWTMSLAAFVRVAEAEQ